MVGILSLILIVISPLRANASNSDQYENTLEIGRYDTTFPLLSVTAYGLEGETGAFNVLNSFNVDTLGIFGRDEFTDGAVQWNERSYIYSPELGASKEVTWTNTLSAYSTNYQFVWLQDYTTPISPLSSNIQRYDFGTFVYDTMYDYHIMPYIAFSYSTRVEMQVTANYDFDVLRRDQSGAWYKYHYSFREVYNVNGAYYSLRLLPDWILDDVATQTGVTSLVVENFTTTYSTTAGNNLDWVSIYNIVDPLAPTLTKVITETSGATIPEEGVLDTVFETVDGFFETPLLGTLSIGTLLMTVVGLGMLFAVLKIFMGG